jgi:hypothetical protein
VLNVPVEVDENGETYLDVRVANADNATAATNADTVDTLHAAESGVDAHVLATSAAGAIQATAVGIGIAPIYSRLLDVNGAGRIWGTAEIYGSLGLTGQLARTTSGTPNYGAIHAVFGKVVADGVATAVFAIDTTNEAGNTDAGSYSCFMQANVSHGSTNDQTTVAVKAWKGEFAGQIINTGASADITPVTESLETASATNDAAVRDITTVTCTVGVVTTRSHTVKFLVDATGSSVIDPAVTVEVTLVWRGFLTPPTLVAA